MLHPFLYALGKLIIYQIVFSFQFFFIRLLGWEVCGPSLNHAISPGFPLSSILLPKSSYLPLISEFAYKIFKDLPFIWFTVS